MSYADQTILFRTPLNTHSGYGKDGILIAEHLMDAGADLHLEPMSTAIPLPPKVAALFCKDRPLRTKHFSLALQHTDPAQLEWPEALPLYADKVVAWTMWEFTGLGSEPWVATIEKRLEVFDLVLAYDATSRIALEPYVPAEKLAVLQGGYDADFWVRDEKDRVRDWDAETFIFVMNGTMNRRKNPAVVLSAFNTLKQEYGDAFNAELHMKTMGMGIHPALASIVPGLKVFSEPWSAARLKNFYLNGHCLLAPSWGEGKNLPALEAQTTGMPVIVSACGGHMEWASQDWAYLVDGTMEEHAPGMGSIRVDADDLAEKMWHVYNNRSEAERKGELAAQVIPAQCDWARVMERLDHLVAGTTAQPRPVDN